jgi:hypothetical protein
MAVPPPPTEESGDIGSAYVGTTYDVGDTNGSPPQITGVDYTTYGNEERGTSGYVILYGTDFTSPYSNTSVSSCYGTPAYLSQGQINLYYSIPVDSASQDYANNMDVTTGYGSATADFYVYDPTPVITSVTPSTWVAGTAGIAIISGTNFGLNSTLVLLGHKRTNWCKLVLWDHASPRQAHKRSASRHT